MTGGTVSQVGIALTFGLIVLSMIHVLSDFSGAHLNPTVTPAVELVPAALKIGGHISLIGSLQRSWLI